MEGVRLNKYLASCGLGSRRACEEWIETGRVEVNGRVCTQLATRIGESDHVRLDGRRVAPRKTMVVAFHKPRGLVCTRGDELGRETIYSLLPGTLHALHHVGRLDRDSEGLLILTNDGDLTQRLMHPTKGVEKEYLVTADQSFENAHLDQFLEGIYTPEGKLKARSIERLSARRIRMVLDHGAKRQIRVMFEALGYHVTKLLRVRIGQLWLGDLAPGDWAQLQDREIELLTAREPLPAEPAARKPARNTESPRKAALAKPAKTPPPRPPRGPSAGTRKGSPARAEADRKAARDLPPRSVGGKRPPASAARRKSLGAKKTAIRGPGTKRRPSSKKS